MRQPSGLTRVAEPIRLEKKHMRRRKRANARRLEEALSQRVRSEAAASAARGDVEGARIALQTLRSISRLARAVAEPPPRRPPPLPLDAHEMHWLEIRKMGLKLTGKWKPYYDKHCDLFVRRHRR